MPDLSAFGDPETLMTAQMSKMMEPAVTGYLGDVFGGRMAQGGLPQNYYDPNRSFSQNALDPRAIEQAIGVAGGFSGGGLGTLRLGPHLGDVYPGSNAQKYPLMRDGGAVGEAHIIPMNEGRTAYVDNVELSGGWQQTGTGGRSGAGQVGPSEMRDLARQLFEMHPDLEQVMGRRVTGARSGTEKADQLVTMTREQAMRGLTPVEHDPFNHFPVEHDPFAQP